LAAVTRDRLNRLKHREPWRPFGPVGTDPGPWWEPVGDLDRYMIGATRMTPRGRAELPAVCHVDATTRPQRLHPGQDTFLQAVLDQAHRGGHPPVLINTSFNGPGEPIVDTAAQAFDCARRLGIDALVTDTTLLTLTGRRRAPRQ
jgi:carbamoyltransferase